MDLAAETLLQSLITTERRMRGFPQTINNHRCGYIRIRSVPSSPCAIVCVLVCVLEGRCRSLGPVGPLDLLLTERSWFCKQRQMGPTGAPAALQLPRAWKLTQTRRQSNRRPDQQTTEWISSAGPSKVLVHTLRPLTSTELCFGPSG